MTLGQLVYAGDSIPQGFTEARNVTYSDGGKGSFVETITNMLGSIPGLGPLLSPGIRGQWLVIGNGAGEWTRPTIGAGSTAVASTDAFDKAPYGKTSGVGAEPAIVWCNGATNIWKWTKPAAYAPIVGFAIDWIDKASGGNWSYRIDGGTWTAMGQTLQNDNHYCRFYVAAAITSTLEIRAANAAGTAVDALPVGIIPFFIDPTTATQGFIVHDIAIATTKLNDLVAPTSGDRLAFLGTGADGPVRLGTGWGSSTLGAQPNLGTVVQHLNDGLLANTTTYAADCSTFYTRASPCGPVGFISDYEGATSYISAANQAALRASWASSAASLGAKYFSIYDWFSARGVTGSAAMNAAGYVSVGLNHLTPSGNAAVVDPLYWFIVNNILANVGGLTTAFRMGKSRVGAGDTVGGYIFQTVSTSAGVASGTGQAFAPKAAGAASPAVASGTGTAFAPTIGATSSSSPAVATGTGQAFAPAAKIAPSAAAATGTGAAGAPTSNIEPGAANAAGTGQAFAPTIGATSNASPAIATGTGAANAPAVSIATDAATASGSGAAAAPASGISAAAASATGSGAAFAPTLGETSTSSPATATGTGAANAPAIAISAHVAVATGTGAAFAAISGDQPSAADATGIGQAFAPSNALAANAGNAAGTGSALAPTVTTSSSGSTSPGDATGTGAAAQPAISVSANAACATGSGAASAPAVHLSPNTSTASGVGTAYQPINTITAPGALATGSGAANAPAVAIAINAGRATGTGSAYQPAIIGQPATSQPATGTGAAAAPTISLAPNTTTATGTGDAYQPTISGGLVIPAVAGGTLTKRADLHATITKQPDLHGALKKSADLHATLTGGNG